VGAAASNLASNLGEDALIVVFEPDSVRAYPSRRLLYYPILPVPDEPPGETFAAGELYEFRTGDFQRAIGYFRRLAETGDAFIRAGALLRLARNQRKAGEPDAALNTYRDLASVEAFVGGRPAELVARRARCHLLKELGRHEQLRTEARTLDDLIQSGRWMLERAAYTHYTAEVRNWFTGDKPSGSGAGGVPPVPSVSLAVAAGVDALWGRWLKNPQDEEMLAGGQSLVSDGQAVSLFWSGTGNRLVALVADPSFVQRRVIGPSESVIERQGIGILLSDSQGETVAAFRMANLVDQYVLRTSSETRLPWTLRVANTDADASRTRLSGRRQLLFAGLGFAVLLVVAVGYFSARAIAREGEAARLQSDFVAAVSHEFRTPLTSMRQFTSMLSDGRVSNDEERGKYYEALSRGTQRLTRLVENLLDFGRLEAGSHGYNMERVCAKDWIERIISEFQEEVDRRGYRVELTWNAPEGSLLLADDAALGRALWNLLDNAVKYSPESKTIWVQGRAEGGWLTLSVRDRGVGIPAKEHRQIFRKFVRGTMPPGRNIRGTGLGLALVEQIVRAHGGTVRLESEVGKGSTFSMRLPRQV
jgi:signal transduction histidine kinase